MSSFVRTYRLWLSLLLLGGLLAIAWMPPRPAADNQDAAAFLHAHHLQRITELDTALVALEKAAQNKRKTDVLQARWTVARDAFKRLEYAIQQFTPQWHRFFNGAKLRVIELTEKQATTFQEWEPIGLQVLEEELFDGMPLDDIHARVLKHTDLMRDRLKRHRVMATKYPPQPGSYIEAFRHELLRIGTLSIADYDSPVLGRGKQEAVVSLTEMRLVLDSLSQRLPVRAALSDSVQTGLSQAIAYLQRDDFSAFYFTRDYLNPLTAQLKTYHLASELHFRDGLRGLTSVNYNATGLYDSTLINPHSFTPWWAKDENSKAAALGRLLFYDPVLSLNNKRACGSCHDPKRAFTDGRRQALGFDKNKTTLRNTPTLINAALSRAYRYDMAATFLDEQSPKVFENHDEFRMTRDSIEARMNASPEYLAAIQGGFWRKGQTD